MIKSILLALALVGAIVGCNSPGASSAATSAPVVSSPSQDLSSPAVPETSPSESPAAS
jgi:hypothetical protein